MVDLGQVGVLKADYWMAVVAFCLLSIDYLGDPGTVLSADMRATYQLGTFSEKIY